MFFSYLGPFVTKHYFRLSGSQVCGSNQVGPSHTLLMCVVCSVGPLKYTEVPETHALIYIYIYFFSLSAVSFVLKIGMCLCFSTASSVIHFTTK